LANEITLFSGQDIRLKLTYYAPGIFQAAHRHSKASYSSLLAGGFCEESDGGCLNAEGPEVLFRPPGFEHENDFGPFGALILSISASDLPLCQERPDLASSHVRQTMLRMAGAPETAWALAPSLFMSSGTSRERGPSTCDAHAIRLRVNAAIAALPDGARVARLSHLMGVHRVHLARLCRENGLSPPREALAWKRRSRAVQAITCSMTPLADVAAICGYADQAHMTRDIKASCGQTPLRLRRTLGPAHAAS